jgi:CRP-like cAMP-binding protein
MLLSGEVQVVMKGKIIDTDSESGSLFGEMSFLLSKTRGASIVVSKPAEFLVVEDPQALVEEQPMILLRMARTLAQRLWNLENRVLERVNRAR